MSCPDEVLDVGHVASIKGGGNQPDAVCAGCLTSGWGVPQTDSPTDAVPLSSTRPKKGSGLFVLWWGEHDAEEHMVGQEYQTLHRPRMPGLRQPQRWGDARLETGQHH